MVMYCVPAAQKPRPRRTDDFLEARAAKVEADAGLDFHRAQFLLLKMIWQRIPRFIDCFALRNSARTSSNSRARGDDRHLAPQ